MYFLNMWGEVTLTVNGAFRSLLLSICETIYKLIVFCFNVYDKVATAKLLDSDTINMFYEKVGLILGVYMIFRLTFVVVQYVLDPDKMTDKSKGASKMLMKVMIVIILLGTTPFIFSVAYKFQSMIATENIIGRLILSSDEKMSSLDQEDTTFGNEIAWYLFSSFYDNSDISSSMNEKCSVLERRLIEADFLKNDSLRYAYNCLNETISYKDGDGKEFEDFIIEFDGLLALIVGGVMLWIIVMYTISVGFRLVQLAFLELIAPLPIMMYLEPKDDGPFQKWIKLCVSCYLDYFIRTAIIYFICFLIQNLMDMNKSYFFATLGDVTEHEYRYIIVIIIFALLIFAKKIPDLIKNIIPSSDTSFSDFGFSFKDRADNMIGGSYINKGFDKATKSIGGIPLTVGKKAISGIDSAVHGKGFLNGVSRYHSQFGQWLNKQKETLMPETYKVSQERREGKEYKKFISNRWQIGVELATKLINNKQLGLGRINNPDGKTDFLSAFDGKTLNNYLIAFDSKEFAMAKFRADQASNHYESIESAIARFKTDPTIIECEIIKENGEKGSVQRDEDLEAMLRKATKAKDDTSTHLAEVSKLSRSDVEALEGFKLLKGNPTDPMDAGKTLESVGLKDKALYNESGEVPGQMRIDGV